METMIFSPHLSVLPITRWMVPTTLSTVAMVTLFSVLYLTNTVKNDYLTNTVKDDYKVVGNTQKTPVTSRVCVCVRVGE